MSDYVSQFSGQEIDARLAKVPQLETGKQDTLVSGTNIKTVNGQSILGSGNIQVQAGDTDAVKYVAQTLTDAQKAQARANIDAASLEDINDMDFVTAASLPTASASTMGHIFLIGPDANDNYDRYFTQESGGTYSWVPLGSTQIDLSTYATKAEVTALEHKLHYPDVSVTVESGYYSTNGASLPSARNSSNSVYSTQFPVDEGDIITIYGTAGSSNHYRLWALYDSSKNRVDRYSSSGDFTINPYVLTIPSGVSFVVINLSSYNPNTDSVTKNGALIDPGEISQEFAAIKTNLVNEEIKSEQRLIHLSKWGSSFSLQIGQYGYRSDTKVIRYNEGDGNGGNNIVDVPFREGAIYRYGDSLYYWDFDNSNMVRCYRDEIDGINNQIVKANSILSDVGKDFLVPIVGSLLADGSNIGLPPETPYTNRARTDEFLFPPFEVNVNSGYRIYAVIGYNMSAVKDTSKGVFGSKYTGYIKKQYAKYEPDGYKYRVVFAKEDATSDILDSELSGIANYSSGLFLTGESEKSFGKYYVDAEETENYSTYESLISAYEVLRAKYPEQVTRTALGTTDQGVSIYEYVIGVGNYNKAGQRGTRDTQLSKPIFGIMAGVHGGEVSSINGLYYIFRDILKGDCALTTIMENAELHIIPCVCPYGFDNGTRTNANGVNINRNFDAEWYEHGSGTNDYSGPSAASEKETQFAQDWIDALKDAGAKIVIDWHNSAYADEVSCFASCNNLITGTDEVKKSFLFNVTALSSLLMKTNNVRDDAIFAYTCTMNGAGYSNKYIDKVGQLGGIVETTYNADEQSNYSVNTSSVSASVMGNALIGWTELFKV